MNVLKFIFFRIIALIAQLLGAIAVIFTLLEFLPYDVTIFFLIRRPLGSPEARAEELARIRAELGLDLPVTERYINYVKTLFFDQSLGNSWISGEDIATVFLEALRYSLFVFGIAFIIYTPLAFVLGIYAAQHRGSWFDKLARLFTTMTYSVPPFILGLWLLSRSIDNGYEYALWPIINPPTETLDILKYSLLPIITVVLVYTGFQFRMIRNQFINILQKDYIRTARAKGLSERVILLKHALRNGLPFFITSIAVTFPIAFSGVAVIEFVFGIPGAGRLMVNSALNFDWPVLIGGTVIFTVINSIVLSITDFITIMISPKLRLGYRERKF